MVKDKQLVTDVSNGASKKMRDAAKLSIIDD